MSNAAKRRVLHVVLKYRCEGEEEWISMKHKLHCSKLNRVPGPGRHHETAGRPCHFERSGMLLEIDETRWYGWYCSRRGFDCIINGDPFLIFKGVFGRFYVTRNEQQIMYVRRYAWELLLWFSCICVQFNSSERMKSCFDVQRCGNQPNKSGALLRDPRRWESSSVRMLLTTAM